MFEEKSESKKLWDIIKAKNPGLDDIEIQKEVDNYMDIANFIVRCWLKQRPRNTENGLEKELGEKSRDSPD